jgi:hypothetical protein
MSRSKICNEVAPATSPATAKLAAEEDPCSLGRHANFLPGISPTKELHEIASTTLSRRKEIFEELKDLIPLS